MSLVSNAADLFSDVFRRCSFANTDRIESIRASLIQALSLSIIEISTDYATNSSTLGVRTKGILARSVLESFFRLNASCKSKHLASRIAYTMASEWSRNMKLMLAVEEAPPHGAAEAVVDAEKEAESVCAIAKESFGNCATISAYDCAVATECVRYYRFHYSTFSNYVHGSYKFATTVNPAAIEKTIVQSFCLSLCCGAESIADFSALADQDEIIRSARAIWSQVFE
jgi:hypothetical protein